MSEIYPAIKALIVKNGKILILKRSAEEDCFKEEWDIPGGRIEFGEIPEVSLKREVKEECGINIDIIKPISIWTFFKNNKKTQVVGVTMLCKYKSGKVKLSDEHMNFKWINPEEIKNYKTQEGIKKDFSAFIKYEN